MSNEQLYIMVGALVLNSAALLFFISRMLDAQNKRIDDLRDLFRAEMKALATELRAEIAALRAEMRAELAAVRAEIKDSLRLIK